MPFIAISPIRSVSTVHSCPRRPLWHIAVPRLSRISIGNTSCVGLHQTEYLPEAKKLEIPSAPATDLEGGQRYLRPCCFATHPPPQSLPICAVDIVGASVQGKVVRSIDRGRIFSNQPPNVTFVFTHGQTRPAGAGWN